MMHWMTSPNGLSRRRFLHVAGLAALPFLRRRRARCSRACCLAGEHPRLRFVQWNDVHLQSSSPTAYRLANEKLQWLVASLNAETLFPRPDFILGIGDMIHGGSLDRLTPDFGLLKKTLAGLKCPFYPMIGNHEDVQQEGDGRYEAAYRAAFGDNRLNYAFQQGGIHFIALNDSGAPRTNRMPVGRRRHDWLRRQLEASPNVPKIICCHIPLTPVREEAVLRKSFGFASYAARRGIVAARRRSRRPHPRGAVGSSPSDRRRAAQRGLPHCPVGHGQLPLRFRALRGIRRLHQCPHAQFA